MFDEDLPKPVSAEFPRNLETMSVDDLNDYIKDLEAEIERVKTDMESKQASTQAADAFFKS